MGLPESNKGLFARVVRTRDTVQVDLNVTGRTALVNGLRETARPFPDQFSLQDNLGSIAKAEDCDSEHDRDKCSFLAKRGGRVILGGSGSYGYGRCHGGFRKCPNSTDCVVYGSCRGESLSSVEFVLTHQLFADVIDSDPIAVGDLGQGSHMLKILYRDVDFEKHGGPKDVLPTHQACKAPGDMIKYLGQTGLLDDRAYTGLDRADYCARNSLNNPGPRDAGAPVTANRRVWCLRCHAT